MCCKIACCDCDGRLSPLGAQDLINELSAENWIDRAGFSCHFRTVITLTPLPRKDSCTKSEAGEVGEKEQIAGRRKEQEQSG